ncbi:MAG: XdhC/CoxI family protein [bacterium]
MKEEKNVIKLLSEAIESGRDAALVTIISSAGSTPRDFGAKMLVYSDGSIAGTVGGGKIEALAIKEAVDAIKKRESRKAVFSLTPKGIGMICMGKVEIFIDTYVRDFKLLILGAGHVGRKIAQAAEAAGIPYDVADDREEFADRMAFPGASRIIAVRPDKAVAEAGVDGRTYIVIVTRGHSLDQECIEKALKTKAAYIGMIGSRHKIPAVFRNLNKKGLHPERDPRVFSPIGLNIGGKTPGEISIAVLSEILKVHNKRNGKHMRDAAEVKKRPKLRR